MPGEAPIDLPGDTRKPFWLARSTRTIFFFAVMLTVAGIYLAFKVPISVFPETNFPRVVIGVDNGVMPVEQMEVTVTRPIEDAVNTVPGLLTVRSTTSRGSAEVSLFFDWNVDMVQSLQLVDAALAKAAQSLPPTARITTNRLTFATFPILGYSLTSDTVPQTQLWEIATYDLKPPLNRVAGVSTVTVQGGQVPEYARGAQSGPASGHRRHHYGSCQRHPGLEHCGVARPLRSQPSVDSGSCRGAGARPRRAAATGDQNYSRRRSRACGRCGHGGAVHHAGLHHGDRERKECGAAQHRAPALLEHRGRCRCGGSGGRPTPAQITAGGEASDLLRSVATGARLDLQRARRHFHRPSCWPA